MTTENQSNRVAPAVPFPWLTVEIVLWGLLLVIALGLRLLRLDAAPLNAIEARGALAAWRFANGQGAPATAGYSPLLFSSQWFTFLVLSASDLSARLLPALAGTALALTPALLREQLGRVAALLAGGLLALSPTALTLSRTASGDVLVALGALLCAGAFWRYVTSQRVSESANTGHAPHSAARRGLETRDTQLAALGIALMLASSPLAYSALLSLGCALLLLALTSPGSRDRLQRGWRALHAAPDLASYALGTLVGGFVLLSTAFGWHLGGLGAAAALLPQWLDGFVRWPDSLSLGYPALILLLYEPLILLTGGAGIILAVIRANAPLRFLALWSAVALALALIRPGRGPGDVLLVLVPLACLGGLALGALVKGLRRWGHWLNEGLILAISGLLWAYLAVNLASYTYRPGQYAGINLLVVNVSLPTYLSLTLASIFLLLVLAFIMGLVQGPGPTLRGLGLAITLALLLSTVAATWGVSQNRPADPRELLVLEPTATEVRLLRETLARLSNERQGDAYAIDLTVLSEDPALSWVLRDFQGARFVEVAETSLSPSAIIAPQDGAAPQSREGYVGQSFPLRRRWETARLACRWTLPLSDFDQVRRLDCSALVQWLVFRRSPERPAEERVVLWVREDLVGR
jgi:4-amino-4-deoxy-L-arabinose transferase-like glycosyltransferase